MGYYSDFEFLEIDFYTKEKDLSDDVLSFISEDDFYEELVYAIDNNACKFYDQHDVMNKLSIEFPDKIFYVFRNGEENGDQEKTFYRNGKMACYRPTITFPEFNEKDLK